MVDRDRIRRQVQGRGGPTQGPLDASEACPRHRLAPMVRNVEHTICGNLGDKQVKRQVAIRGVYT
jgi:hypothetical protein